MAKFRVDTDKGSYIVETEDPVPGMEKLGGFAPGPAPAPLPRSLVAAGEMQDAFANAPKTRTGMAAHVLASPLTGIMGVGPEIVNWAERGGHNAAPTGGFMSEEPVTQAYGNALMALGTEHSQVKPRPGQQFKPSAIETGGKTVSGGVKGLMKGIRSSKASGAGLIGNALGTGATMLTGIPGLGRIATLLTAGPELLKSIREGVSAELNPPNPYASKSAMAAQLARTTDPYANPTPRDSYAGPRPLEGRTPNTPDTIPPPEFTPRQARAGSMEYDAPAPPASRRAAGPPKPKPEPKPKPATKAQREADTAAAMAGYAPPRDPSPRPTLPEPPVPVAEQGVGAGSMEYGGPEPPPPPSAKPPKPLTKAEKAADLAAAQAGYAPPRGAAERPAGSIPEPPAPSPEWLRSPAGQAWQERQSGVRPPMTGPMDYEVPPAPAKPGKAGETAKPAASETAGGLPKDVLSDAEAEAFLEKLRNRQRPPREPSPMPEGERNMPPRPGETLMTPESERLGSVSEVEPKSGALSPGSEGPVDMEYIRKLAEPSGEKPRTVLFRWMHEAYRDLHGTGTKDTHGKLSGYVKEKYGVESLRDLTEEQALNEYNLLNRAAHLKREAPGLPPEPK